MDAVKSFNAELSSLYEVKPPISKAKMTAITRGAIKAIKFYKHVVQSVEKFILKCKPEYKVPGLYVIDSIVRQSRHQFGADKDVFAPRFAKNMRQTFINLFSCPPEDKSKIIRVLNLWQKNQVFAPEVIQPLFDLADPNNPIHKELGMGTPQQSNGMNANAAIVKGSPALQKTPTKGSQQGVEGAHLGGTNLNLTDPNVLVHLQQLQRLLTRGGDAGAKNEGPVHFDRKLLEYDYGDEEDESHSTPKAAAANDSVTSLLTNPEVLRQLQTLQQSLTGGQSNEVDIDKLRKLQEMKQQEEEFDKHLAQTVPNLPFASECEFKPGNNSSIMSSYFMPPGTDLSHPPPGYKPPQPFEISQQNVDSDVQFLGGENDNGGDVEIINLDHGDSRSLSPPDDRYNRRRRSRSRERSRDRRDRDRRSRRSRSRSKTRRHRSRSKERIRGKEKESEKDKERKKRGLPAIKKDNLSVCSTTLWVGHLSKLVHQEDLSNTFGEFGDIVSIDLIPPRGCAFIVMHRRQDAARCLAKLKNHILHGKGITLAWAPGKGVKGKDLKDYWEGDLGVSYIPWAKLKPDIDIELLEDGGMVDEDTMPAWMKAKVSHTSQKVIENQHVPFMSMPDIGNPPAGVDTSQPPPVPGAGLLQPPPMTLPLVSPFQFSNRLLGTVGMNIPGMLQNVPIGVPPPTIPGAIMQNQLVGIGSPFQGATNIMASMAMQNSDKQVNSNEMKLSDSLIGLSQSFGMIPQSHMGLSSTHDDNMDIEMEDAEKPERPPMLLSEQLAASIGHFNMNQGGHRPNPGGLGSDLDLDNRRDKRIDRDRRRSRSRDRDRNRERERDRSRGMNRDQDFPNRDDRRDRKDDRRERGNRWGDRDPDIDRREREKTLNDRLQQMANEGVYPPPVPERGPPRDRNDSEGSMPPVAPVERRIFPPHPGPPIDHPIDHELPEPYGGGPPDDFNDEVLPPPEDYPPIMDGPHFDHPNFQPNFDEPIHPRMHRDEFEGDRFMRGGRRGFRDNFEPRMRGQGDFFPPRDDFPPGPGPGPGPRMMRGGPDFPGQRPPLMRGPGPHMKFHPRGMPPRMRGGPRPNAPWRENPNFHPRFDNPDFPRGPMRPPGPPGMFDEPPHFRHRGGRFEDRRRPRQDFPNEGGPPENERFERGGPPENERFERGGPPETERFERGGPPENERFERRTRWGNNSPSHDERQDNNESVNIAEADVQLESDNNKGGNTPLHDEPLNRENTESRAHDVEDAVGNQAPEVAEVSTENSQTEVTA